MSGADDEAIVVVEVRLAGDGGTVDENAAVPLARFHPHLLPVQLQNAVLVVDPGADHGDVAVGRLVVSYLRLRLLENVHDFAAELRVEVEVVDVRVLGLLLLGLLRVAAPCGGGSGGGRLRRLQFFLVAEPHLYHLFIIVVHVRLHFLQPFLLHLFYLCRGKITF